MEKEWELLLRMANKFGMGFVSDWIPYVLLFIAHIFIPVNPFRSVYFSPLFENICPMIDHSLWDI